MSRIAAESFPDCYAVRVADLWEAWFRFLGFTGAVAGATAVLAWGAIDRDWSPLPAALVGAVAVWLTISLLLSLNDLRTCDRVARIVPYFLVEVPGPKTFFEGHALARQCRRLDDLALAAGQTPLSAYGFADDLRGEPVDWHDAVEALRTVQHLIETLRRAPEAVPEAEALLAELEPLRDRLAEAARLEVPFCLHLRMDWAYSGHEFDVREGKY
jgi:hypothetical protein